MSTLSSQKQPAGPSPTQQVAPEPSPAPAAGDRGNQARLANRPAPSVPSPASGETPWANAAARQASEAEPPGLKFGGELFAGAKGSIPLAALPEDLRRETTLIDQPVEVPGRPLPQLAGGTPYLRGTVKVKMGLEAEAKLNYQWDAGTGTYQIGVSGGLDAKGTAEGSLAGGVRWGQAVGGEGFVKVGAELGGGGSLGMQTTLPPENDAKGSLTRLTGKVGSSGQVTVSGGFTVWALDRSLEHSITLAEQPILSLTGGEASVHVDLAGGTASVQPLRRPRLQFEMPDFLVNDDQELIVNGREAELPDKATSEERQQAIAAQGDRTTGNAGVQRNPLTVGELPTQATPDELQMAEDIRGRKWGGKLSVRRQSPVERGLDAAQRAQRDLERTERQASFDRRWSQELMPGLLARGARRETLDAVRSAWQTAIVDLDRAESAANARAIRLGNEAVRAGREASFPAYWAERRPELLKESPQLGKYPAIFDNLRRDYQTWFVGECKGDEPREPIQDGTAPELAPMAPLPG